MAQAMEPSDPFTQLEELQNRVAAVLAPLGLCLERFVADVGEHRQVVLVVTAREELAPVKPDAEFEAIVHQERELQGQQNEQDSMVRLERLWRELE